MSRERAELVHEDCGTVLKIKLHDLLDWLPEDVTRELLSLACANGEALRMLAHQIVPPGTVYTDRPEYPACDAWLGSETIESLRVALAPMAAPAAEEAFRVLIKERDAARDRLKPLLAWAEAELAIEAYRVTGRVPNEWDIKRAEERRRECIEIVAKLNPYIDRRPKQLTNAQEDGR